jgi:uncharacterized delta-60 repeat protein
MRTRISLVLLVFGLAFSTPIRALAAPGDLDATFGSGGVALGKAGGVLQIAIDASGDFVTTPLQRHLPDGSLDASFGPHGQPRRFGGTWFAAALQGDGKIVALGWKKGNGLRVGRFLPSGAVDRSFGRDGLVARRPHSVLYDAVFAGGTIGVQSTGKIVFRAVEGEGVFSENLILRLMPDGSPDLSFGTGGAFNLGGFQGGYNRDSGFAVASDDKIFASIGPWIVRLLPDGEVARFTLANSFLPMFDTAQLVVRPDGSVVAIGKDLCLVPGTACGGVTRFVRLLADGTLDPGFGAFGELAYASPNHPVVDAFALAVQPGGQIVFTGNTVVGPLQAAVVTGRLLPDGEIDSGFGTNGETETAVGDPLDYTFALALQSDGKIVAGGYSQHVRRGSDQVSSLLLRYLP